MAARCGLGMAGTTWNSTAKRLLPNIAVSQMTASSRPKSPTRLTMNA